MGHDERRQQRERKRAVKRKRAMMKVLLFPFVLALSLDVVFVQAAGGLFEKFNIGGPQVEKDSLTFRMSFTVNDSMTDAMVGYTVYDGMKCKDEDGGDNDITINSGYLSSSLVSKDDAGDGESERTITVATSLNPTDGLEESPIFHKEEEHDATVRFCIRFSVYNADKDSDGAIEINFLENPVELRINFSADINIDAKIVKSNIEEIDA